MRNLSQFHSCARFGAIFLIAIAFATAHGQSTRAYNDVHNMYQASGFAQTAAGGVTFDSSGNAYGTAKSGGSLGGGLVWELTFAGSFNDIHDFGGTITTAEGTGGDDGSSPNGRITIDSSGNLFGTATTGGPRGVGMAWEITSGGTYVDLHDFGGTTTLANGSSGSDGSYPYGYVSVDSSGAVFGTTTDGGGHMDGMVWEIQSGGTYKDLHDFGGTITLASGSSGVDGETPQQGPTLDSSGNLYGTTYVGTPFGAGNIWEITVGGTYIDLHDFGGTTTVANGTIGADGASPNAGVMVAPSGNLYGCTSMGGGAAYSGMVWEITSGGTYRDLHDFAGTVKLADGTNGTDGSQPQGDVVIDSSGNLYGTTVYGGENNSGVVWELTAGAIYIDQHDFGGSVTYPDGTTGTDGINPFCGVTLDSSGNIWGTAGEGAVNSMGNLYMMFTPGFSSFTLNPSTIIGGYSTTGTITLNGIVGANTTITLSNEWPTYVTVPHSVTIPGGSNSVTFTASVPHLYSATFQDTITANLGLQSEGDFLTVTGEKLSSMTVSPTSMSGFGTSTGTVTITNPAPPGGWIVNLKSALPSYVSVPSTVTVAEGATTANFTLTGLGAHVSNVTCSIYATDVASGTSASITLQGDSIASLSLNPSTMGWNGVTTGTVMLNTAAPTGGWVVNLSAGASGYLSMPASVTIPEGATSATFSINGAAQHSSNLSIRVNGSDGATSAFSILSLEGDSLSSLSLSPSKVAPGQGSTGTITLSSPAPVGGWKVNLTVGAPSLVGVPPSVIVPAGSTSVTFPLVTYIGEPASAVTVIANDGTSQEQTTLVIT